MNRLLRIAAGTAVVAATLAFAGVASAHSNTVTCQDQTTSTWRITNDYPLAESFTSPQGPAGNVAAGNGSYTDVVYVGDSLQIDAVWSDGFTESRTGTGDCTPEGGTTTTSTEAPTSTSTSTTEVATTTTATSTTTSTPTSTTSTLATTTTDVVTTTTTPNTSTSSSVETTSTTSLPSSTTEAPPSSSPPPAPSSTTPECSDNPNTPTDDCAPICQPVTQPDGTNSCGPSLPATGADVGWLILPAFMMLLCGGVIVICGRRR